MTRASTRAAVLLLLGVLGCGQDERPPNLVVVVVDTLRTSRLHLYGAERETSPSLDALAEESVVFERAYAAAPWTKPSVASLLTGRYPRRHGLVRMGKRLPENATTLPEILSGNGFATAGVVSHSLIGTDYGFERGFALFSDAEARGHRGVSSPLVTEKALAFLDRLSASGSPFFLFVHYFDPHFDYVRHPEIGYAAQRAGRLQGGEPILRLRAMQLRPREVGFLTDVYDEEIRFTDDAIGSLVAGLRERGLFEDTVVVVTADHGEELLERGWLGHTRTLYDELVHVPLLVRAPGVPARRVAEPVSLVALAPTLLELLGLPAPGSAGFEHGSLVTRMRGEAGEAPPEPVFAEVDFLPGGLLNPKQTPKQKEQALLKRARLRAVVSGEWKLIHDELEERIALYHLGRDPGEQEDLAAREPGRVADLRALLDEGLGPEGPQNRGAAVRFTPEQIEELRALGYAN